MFNTVLPREDCLRMQQEAAVDVLAARLLLEIQTLNTLGSLYAFLKANNFLSRAKAPKGVFDNIKHTLLSLATPQMRGPITDSFEIVETYLPDQMNSNEPSEMFPFNMLQSSTFLFNGVLVNLGLHLTRDLPSTHHNSIMIVADPNHDLGEVIITPNDQAIPPLRGKVNDEACLLLRDYYEQFSKINKGPIEETFMYRIGVSVVEKAQELKKGREADILVGKSVTGNVQALFYFRAVMQEYSKLFHFGNNRKKLILKKGHKP